MILKAQKALNALQSKAHYTQITVAKLSATLQAVEHRLQGGLIAMYSEGYETDVNGENRGTRVLDLCPRMLRTHKFCVLLSSPSATFSET